MGFQETLSRLAMIDEGFVADQARTRSWLGRSVSPGSRDRLAASGRGNGGAGAPAASLEWSTTRALAAGASEDEIADVLLAIAPVAGLGRVIAVAPCLGTALGMTSKPRWRKQAICNGPLKVTFAYRGEER